MSLIVNITKKLNNFTLNVDFNVEDEIFAMLGASGCGKSMTLKCIAGIETPDNGHIEFNKKVLFDSKKSINLLPQKRHIGYLFQNYALFPNMTVRENILFAADGNKAEKNKIVEKNIKRFHLQGLENNYPASLSGGQQQRTAFARILAARAELLMLDEPFSALDSYLKWQLELELSELLERYKKTTLFVSHNRDEVYRLCSRIAVMDQGNIEVISDKYELFNDPRTAAATILTGCKNISHAKKIDAHHLYASDWQLTLTCRREIPDNLTYIGFRAHFFKIENEPDAANCFPCQIDRVIEDTFSFVIMIRSAEADTSAKTMRWELSKNSWLNLSKKAIFLSIPEEKIILLKK
ncbi:sulfate/molybdate ABC transporter ATP-binding protein [Pectinatus frisingensis]|uniref:sulfate/molybdate ABC transporter ATP-binding protein n=1 Tax=Pectinatus frisingensis TaxID=865 RepID=UPI0018C7A5DF|nr:ATP-binding cassette domain-containing protein [Pectinatus frisingensis]